MLYIGFMLCVWAMHNLGAILDLVSGISGLKIRSTWFNWMDALEGTPIIPLHATKQPGLHACMLSSIASYILDQCVNVFFQTNLLEVPQSVVATHQE